MAACSECNEPCIVINGRCAIAKRRIATGESFEHARAYIQQRQRDTALWWRMVNEKLAKARAEGWDPWLTSR